MILCADRVADGENAGIEHADDIPRIRLGDSGALLRHHLLGLGELDLLACLHVKVFRIPLEFSGDNAQKGDAVAVRFVHVRLNFKDERREGRGEGIDRFVPRNARKGRGGHL